MWCSEVKVGGMYQVKPFNPDYPYESRQLVWIGAIVKVIEKFKRTAMVKMIRTHKGWLLTDGNIEYSSLRKIKTTKPTKGEGDE